MRPHLFCVVVAVFLLGTVTAQTPAPGGDGAAPTLDQLRQAVSRLSHNRVAVPTSYDLLTAEQQAYVRGILSGPRADISAPLGVMLVSPGLGDLTQKAMAYARFAGRDGFSSVPPKLNELAILVVAKHWSANYVWNAHHRYAVQVGVPQAVVDAILAGTRPLELDEDVRAVYDFATELLATRQVSDATLRAARRVLKGDRGVVDLVGTMGLYQLTAMMVRLDQTPLAAGVRPFFD